MDPKQAYASATTALLSRFRSEAKSQYFDLKRVAIRAHALVEGEGAPLVLVHGGGGNASVWAPIIHALSTTHHVIAVDRPGCGLSDAFDYAGVNLITHATDFLQDVFDAMEIERALLVGNSMGGLFSAAFAAAHPERVSGLVLVGSPAGATAHAPLPLRLLSTPGLNRILWNTAMRPSPATSRRALRMNLVARPERVVGEQVEAMYRGHAMPHARDGWLGLLENCVSLRGFNPRFLAGPVLAEVKVPTRFVWGTEDKFQPPAVGPELVSRMSNASLTEIAGAGHLPWLDDAPAVRREIQEFDSKNSVA